MGTGARATYGDTLAREVSQRIAGNVATIAELKALGPSERTPGMIAVVLADCSVWRWHGTSALTGDDVLVSRPSDAPSAGRWLRCPGYVDLALPFTFSTADAAALLTGQAGQKMLVQGAYWEITTAMTGGSTPAIGLSSSKTTPTNWSTKGDVLGGSSGDVTATLVAGVTAGTIGTDMDTIAKIRGFILGAADTIKFDRIASAFDAGAGNAHIVGVLLKNDGA